jgi:N6-L-threonylcarbamoyladenine synthase
VEVLAAKALAALRHTGLGRLVIAGGVGANLTLRARLAVAVRGHGAQLYYPEIEYCTDNGAMIAFAAAQRLKHSSLIPHPSPLEFTVRPRWGLESLAAAG